MVWTSKLKSERGRPDPCIQLTTLHRQLRITFANHLAAAPLTEMPLAKTTSLHLADRFVVGTHLHAHSAASTALNHLPSRTSIPFASLQGHAMFLNAYDSFDKSLDVPRFALGKFSSRGGQQRAGRNDDGNEKILKPVARRGKLPSSSLQVVHVPTDTPTLSRLSFGCLERTEQGTRT